jgi:hypothetical protein
VPELQRRGRSKTAYREGTFRHKLFGRGDRCAGASPRNSARNRLPVRRGPCRRQNRAARGGAGPEERSRWRRG